MQAPVKPIKLHPEGSLLAWNYNVFLFVAGYMHHGKTYTVHGGLDKKHLLVADNINNALCYTMHNDYNNNSYFAALPQSLQISTMYDITI